MKYSLALEQIDFWQNHHYLSLTDFFDVSQKRKLLDWIDEVIALPENPKKWMHTFEFTGLHHPRITLIEHFLEENNSMNELARGARTTSLIDCLMGEKTCLFQENIQFFYPGSKGRLPRQDALDFNVVGPTHHISFLVALDKTTLLMPEGFKYQQKLLTTYDSALPPKTLNKIHWQPIELFTGDVVLIDSYLPYTLPPNLSDLPMRILQMSYNKISDGAKKRDAFFNYKSKLREHESKKQTEKTYA